jgi:hypothetical protein
VTSALVDQGFVLFYDGLKIRDQPCDTMNYPAIQVVKIAARRGLSPAGHEPIGPHLIPLDPATRL